MQLNLLLHPNLRLESVHVKLWGSLQNCMPLGPQPSNNPINLSLDLKIFNVPVVGLCPLSLKLNGWHCATWPITSRERTEEGELLVQTISNFQVTSDRDIPFVSKTRKHNFMMGFTDGQLCRKSHIADICDLSLFFTRCSYHIQFLSVEMSKVISLSFTH